MLGDKSLTKGIHLVADILVEHHIAGMVVAAAADKVAVADEVLAA